MCLWLGNHIDIQRLAKDCLAILAMTGVPGIERVGELHKCIALMHGDARQSAVDLKHALDVRFGTLKGIQIAHKDARVYRLRIL